MTALAIAEARRRAHHFHVMACIADANGRHGDAMAHRAAAAAAAATANRWEVER